MCFLLKILKIKIFILVFFVSFFSSAFVNPGDNDYLIFEEERYRIIFDKQYSNSIDEINQKIKTHIDSMFEFKNRSLEKPITVILFSSRNQISNAFATVFPSFTIGMYPTGVLGLNELTLPFWFDGVFEHELNHVFQMSHSKYSEVLNKVFNLPSLIFFYIYTPYPNIFLPMFVVEGDSVLKESLFNYGGRLYNGYVRAFVYSQIKHYQHQVNQFTIENLLQLRLTPHSAREKYLHGGYFMTMLAEKYSHETINSFFKLDKKIPPRKIRKQIKEISVKEKLSPFFAEQFSFPSMILFLEDLVKSYFNRWLKEASLQKSSPEPILFKNHVCPPFGSVGDDIFFLTADFKSTPTLRVFNKNTKKWTEEKMDLPLGKVFKIDDVYYARSSRAVRPYVTYYSLFSEGLYNNKTFDSQYVQDLQNNKTLYIDPKNNLDGFKLYLNNSFYSDVHSNALFDKKGNIYFFKQKDKIRTLYKNKRPLFSYSGYYGNLLEIEEDGTIYFTGSSPYGSSIYQYKNGGVFRSVSSDTVIQAKKINKKEFIACEITPYGYEYKIIPIERRREKPVLYKYNFKKRKPIHKTVSVQSNPLEKDRMPNTSILGEQQVHRTSYEESILDSVSQQAISQGQTSKAGAERQLSSVKKDRSENQANPLEYKAYSPLGNLQYNGLSIQGITTGAISILGAGVLFSDYLMQNMITLAYNNIFPYFDFTDGLQLASISYQNFVYPLEWELGYQFIYNPATLSASPSDKSVSDLEHAGYLQLGYPLFEKGRWFSSLSSLKRFKLSEDSETEGLWRGRINFGYSRFFPYNYAPNKASVLSVFFDNRYYFDKELNGLKAGAIWDSSFYLGRDFYMFPSLSYTWSFHPEVNPAQVSLYRWASFEELDYYNSSAFSSSSDPYRSYFEDMGSSGFVIGDLYGPLFKSRYKARSIGVASLGFKKVFGTGNRFVPLARVRWMILENLLSHGSIDLDGVASSDAGQFSEGGAVKQIQEQIELTQYKKQKKEVKPDQYIQWLEWTAGFEYELIISGKVRIILGFSLGIRTPLKFWESSSNEDTSSDTEATESSVVSGTLDSAFTQLHFKMPF